MVTIPSTSVNKDITYPTGDGRPVAETPIHRDNLLNLIEMLRSWYARDPRVYISGNMFVYYVAGDPHKHVAPDVFVVRDLPPGQRDYYLVWEEGKGPDLVIELTSASTRKEDLKDKFQLYQDTLKVREYFLFDPYVEYLKPPLQGYRLRKGKYMPIKRLKGRLPSKVLGLHLEQDGSELRLYDPATGQRVLTPREALAQTAEALRQEAGARQQAEAEVARLRRELETLRRQRPRRR